MLSRFSSFFPMGDGKRYRVEIDNIKSIPQTVLEKYGQTRPDGTKYLEDKKGYSHPEWCDLIVYYIIDIEAGTAEVEWEYFWKS